MKKTTLRGWSLALLGLALSSTRLPSAWAHGDEKVGEHGALDNDTPKALMAKVGIDQKMDSQVPLNMPFTDESGKTVTLANYMGRRPLVLNLISYTCTQVCTAEAEVIQATLHDLPFRVGKEFDMVTISIDPRETTAMAMAHKEENIKNYGHKESAKGWHFLTGSESSIKALASSIGYRYVLNPTTKEYLHPDGLIVLTPQGRVSRYFYRLNYPARDVKFGLIEASQSKIGSPLDYFALSCFHYNPTTGKYDLVISAILRISAIATVLGMALGIWLMLRAEKKRAVAPMKTQSV